MLDCKFDRINCLVEPKIGIHSFRLTHIKKDRQNGKHRKGRVFIEGAELDWQITNGRDSKAVRSRFTTQRKIAEFLSYKRILFVCRE